MKGVNFEHSSIDGHTALRFVSDIFAETIVSFAQSITKSIYGNTDKVPSVLTAAVKPKGYTTDTYPKHIDFHLPPEILKGIYHAEVAVGDEICGLDSHVLEFQEFGKTYITSKKLRYELPVANWCRNLLLTTCFYITVQTPSYRCQSFFHTIVSMAKLPAHTNQS